MKLLFLGNVGVFLGYTCLIRIPPVRNRPLAMAAKSPA
jgi:hypothetical protein